MRKFIQLNITLLIIGDSLIIPLNHGIIKHYLSTIIICILLLHLPACSNNYKQNIKENSAYENLDSEYDNELYLTGTFQVESTGNLPIDKRRAEILARLEIAKQIKIKVKSITVDLICHSSNSTLKFISSDDCKNQFSMIVEETVDQILTNSKIAKSSYSKNKKHYYAVAILKRKDASQTASKNLSSSLNKIKEYIQKASKSTNNKNKELHKNNAQKELQKSIVYNSEKLALDTAKSKIEPKIKNLFNILATEINNIDY